MADMERLAKSIDKWFMRDIGDVVKIVRRAAESRARLNRRRRRNSSLEGSSRSNSPDHLSPSSSEESRSSTPSAEPNRIELCTSPTAEEPLGGRPDSPSESTAAEDVPILEEELKIESDEEEEEEQKETLADVFSFHVVLKNQEENARKRQLDEKNGRIVSASGGAPVEDPSGNQEGNVAEEPSSEQPPTSFVAYSQEFISSFLNSLPQQPSTSSTRYNEDILSVLQNSTFPQPSTSSTRYNEGLLSVLQNSTFPQPSTSSTRYNEGLLSVLQNATFPQPSTSSTRYNEDIMPVLQNATLPQPSTSSTRYNEDIMPVLQNATLPQPSTSSGPSAQQILATLQNPILPQSSSTNMPFRAASSAFLGRPPNLLQPLSVPRDPPTITVTAPPNPYAFTTAGLPPLRYVEPAVAQSYMRTSPSYGQQPTRSSQPSGRFSRLTVDTSTRTPIRETLREWLSFDDSGPSGSSQPSTSSLVPMFSPDTGAREAWGLDELMSICQSKGIPLIRPDPNDSSRMLVTTPSNELEAFHAYARYVIEHRILGLHTSRPSSPQPSTSSGQPSTSSSVPQDPSSSNPIRDYLRDNWDFIQTAFQNSGGTSPNIRAEDIAQGRLHPPNVQPGPVGDPPSPLMNLLTRLQKESKKTGQGTSTQAPQIDESQSIDNAAAANLLDRLNRKRENDAAPSEEAGPSTSSEEGNEPKRPRSDSVWMPRRGPRPPPSPGAGCP